MADFNPHPEWKRLYHVLKDSACHGMKFSYAELKELSGIDARTSKGRQQFLRFRKELLRTHSLFFENVRGEGYRIVDGSEHSRAGGKQLNCANRRIRFGAEIVYNTRIDSLTAEQRKANADVLSRLGRIASEVKQQRASINKLIAVVEQKRLPPPAGLTRKPDTLDAAEVPTEGVAGRERETG